VVAELKVLSILVGDADLANVVMPMDAFMEALQAGIFRLRDVQIAMTGPGHGHERKEPDASRVSSNYVSFNIPSPVWPFSQRLLPVNIN
jgi:hypothetical protein